MDMTQGEYNQFYDKLKDYALKVAGKMFKDIAFRDEAIDNAMDRVVDKLLKGGMGDKSNNYCKTIIRNSLINSLTRAKILPEKKGKVSIYTVGFSIRKIKDW